MNDFSRFAMDLDKASREIVRQGRGAAADQLDAAASEAQQRAVALWSERGRGLSGSAGTIRARMSRDRSKIAGWLLADGEGAFFQENGTGHHPPQPVLGPALERARETVPAAVGRMLARLIR